MTMLASELSSRLERLPLSRWHWRVLGIIGLAWCFDGFDSTIIGAIGAALQKQWQIDPRTMGFLLSSNLAGAVVGALLASLADRLGRKRMFQWSLIWFSLLSFACAFSWNMPSLIGFRFLMGFGLGDELPEGFLRLEQRLGRHGAADPAVRLGDGAHVDRRRLERARRGPGHGAFGVDGRDVRLHGRQMYAAARLAVRDEGLGQDVRAVVAAPAVDVELFE